MHDQVTAIKEYYINLDYVQDTTAAEEEVFLLIEQITQKYFDTLSQRFLATALMIKNNWCIFASLCKHVDVINTIMEYLTNILIKLKFAEDHVNKTDLIINPINPDETRQLTLLALYGVCSEFAVRSFLSAALASTLNDFRIGKYAIVTEVNEMIILEDSDLDAVVSCLRIIENCELTKIWVHELIKEKFLWLKMKYFRDSDFPIHTFRSKQELFTSHTYDNFSIVSIWSENIVAAKDLAKSFNKTNILFINTHNDFYGDVVLVPYKRIMYSVTHLAFELDCSDDFVPRSSENEVDATSASKMISSSFHNLFYNGKWQKSAKATYYKCNDSLWANATRDDIQECLYSAQKGFEIWSTRSIYFRCKILRDAMDIITFNGCIEFQNNLVDNLILNGYFRDRTRFFQRKRLEVTEERMPLGIVVLKETDVTVFFDRLLKILMAGNSVIVIHNANLYNFAPHCDIFSMCGIPSGVINMLSHEDSKYLELLLCRLDYASYVRYVYSDNSEFPVVPKHILLPLK